MSNKGGNTVKIVTAAEFNTVIKDKTVIVDFYADWCGPCKMISPVLEELSKEHTDVTFIKVNVDQENELAMKYEIMSIPAIFAFKNGEVANKVVGFQAKPQLEAFVQSVK